jgi:cell division protease FtsH
MNGKNPIPPRTHFSIWYIIAAFLIMYMLQIYVFGPKEKEIPYSEFKALVAQGRVKEVKISSQIITGTYEPKAEHTTSDEYKGKDRASPAAQKSGEEHLPLFRTVRVEDSSLVHDLETHGVTFTGEYQSPLLKGILGWVVPLFILFALWGVLFKKIGAGGAGVMSFGKSRAKLYAQQNIGVTFDDVAGEDEAKEELKEIIDFLKSPERFQILGGRIPKGVLLVGPPGTGKTLLAKAVAGEADVPFFSLSGSDFVEMFVGVGAARVRDLFAQAQEKAPCIIFIDELDALGKARGVNPIGGNDEREQTLNQLLAEMDGFDPKKGVIIVAATNRPEILDPALLRAGRFDRHIMVDRPDLLGREAVLRIHSQKIKLGRDVDLKTLAARTPGMVGADLANVVNEAALLAARKNKQSVDMVDFEAAIDRVVAGPEKKTRVMSKREKERVAYHELGHALVAESLPHADPVHKVSIIPRGIGALGYTEQLPIQDHYLMTKSELLDGVAVLLGGRAAEEVIFGEVSTGAQNDLEKASDICRRMLTEYGMSDRQGPITFEKERRPLFLDTGYSPPREYSQETANEIDEEFKGLVKESYEKAKKILMSKQRVLKKIARILLEKEVMEGDELRRLLKEEAGKPATQRRKRSPRGTTKTIY